MLSATRVERQRELCGRFRFAESAPWIFKNLKPLGIDRAKDVFALRGEDSRAARLATSPAGQVIAPSGALGLMDPEQSQPDQTLG